MVQGLALLLPHGLFFWDTQHSTVPWGEEALLAYTASTLLSHTGTFSPGLFTCWLRPCVLGEGKGALCPFEAGQPSFSLDPGKPGYKRYWP
jgi:hypothetical protein